MRRRGYDVVVSREPGGAPLAEKVRALVLDEALPLSNTSQVLLYLAARSEHVEKTLRPALAAGKIVLCDRFSDSTLAYQGLALGKRVDELGELRRLNAFASGGLTPDLTLLLDGRPEVLARRREERGVSDRYELQGLEYQERLRQGFLALAQAEPERIKIIDAENDRQTVAADVRRALDALLDEAD